MAEILTVEQWANNLRLAMSDDPRAPGACVRLGDHDAALRASLAAEKEARGSLMLHYAEVLHDARAKQEQAEHRLADAIEDRERVRGVTLARALKAEADLAAAVKERDEARRMYCVEATCRSDEDFTPRNICEDCWPDSADVLFPKEVHHE